MAFSPASSAPSIRVYDPGAPRGFPLPAHRPPSLPRPSVAMAIPNAKDEEAPPPLIPDRNIGKRIQRGDDAAWKWGNTPNNSSFGGHRPFGDIKPGSSLLGGSGSHFQQRGSVSRSLGELTLTNDMDDSDDDNTMHHAAGGSRSLDANGQTITRLAKTTNSHASVAYDRQVLDRLKGVPSATTPSTPTHATPPPPRLTVSTQEPTIHRTASPHHSVTPQEPSNRHSRRPSEAAPVFWRSGSGPMSPAYTAFRSPSVADGELTPHSIHQHRGSYDHSVFSESDGGTEDAIMREPALRNRSPAGSEEYQPGSMAGQKRRASSPPSEATRDDRALANGSLPSIDRRGTLNLVPPPGSPMQQRRCHTNPSSLSSTSSFPSHRHQSLGSTFTTFSGASSMTSYNGDQMISPGALPPSGEPDGSVLPYVASRSLDPSPRASLPHRPGLPNQEQPHLVHVVSPDPHHFIRQGSVSGQMGGTWACSCCPKKQKKFNSEAELHMHESEKQYACQFCPNRFKNKNEAERHQNSLHIRSQSWSCAALPNMEAAFHPSNPDTTDTCGYCGREFQNPPNWEDRRKHLNLDHKYGECNKGKQFFRADHFRQHLKHTHAGLSGRWTNHLENACMQISDPGTVTNTGQSGPSPATSLAPQPDVIDEAQNES